MLTVRKSSVFPASEKEVYSKLQKLKTLQYIAYPYATFEPVGLEEGILTNETNKHVPVWNHEITLDKMDENKTRYTDIVEIDAGWKTVFVYFWPVCFYAHRQRKCIKLLKVIGWDGKSRKQKTTHYYE